MAVEVGRCVVVEAWRGVGIEAWRGVGVGVVRVSILFRTVMRAVSSGRWVVMSVWRVA